MRWWKALRNPTVVRSPAAREAFAIRPMTLREAFVRAIDEGGAAQCKTDTRLADRRRAAGAGVRAHPAHRRRQRVVFRRCAVAAARVARRLRGWCRHAPTSPRSDACAVGDVIDGWRVEAYEPDRLLRLAAGLKLPGRGWLEFLVTPLGDGTRSLIRQTATFDPHGVRADSIGTPCCRSTRSCSAVCCGGSRAGRRPRCRTRSLRERRRPASSPVPSPHAGRRPVSILRPTWTPPRIPLHGPSWRPWYSSWISLGRPSPSSSSSPPWPGRGPSRSAASCCGSGRQAT